MTSGRVIWVDFFREEARLRTNFEEGEEAESWGGWGGGG